VDEEHVFHGEIITPDFIQWMRVCDLHQAFDDFCRRYGREQATKLWHEIPEEHDDDR
jgi:hypothetical protein